MAAEIGTSADVNPELSPDNIAPIVAYLASDKSDWASGRTFQAMGYNVGLYNNPEVIADISSDGPWSLRDLASKVESAFKPIASGLPARG